MDWLKSLYDQDQRIKYLFFWGHRPNRDGSIGSSCLSQWWPAPFQQGDLEFKTAEHWMMYQKAILFEDKEIGEQIIKCKTAAEAKKWGRKVRNFNPKTWQAQKCGIVVAGNQLKFAQHPDLQQFLLRTNRRVLVEASPVDKIWGIGLHKDTPNIENPYTWKGLNLLGFALMEVRDILLSSK